MTETMVERESWQYNFLYMILIPSITTVTLLYIAWKRKRYLSSKYPPYISGRLPWIGCAIEFGKQPLQFIQHARNQVGPIFTLMVAGKRMTFLLDNEDFHHFFLSENVDFQKAVQDTVKKTAGISENGFFMNHTKIHDTVKGKLASSKLKPVCTAMCSNFHMELSSLGRNGKGDLMKLVRSTMYKAVIDHLFGKGVLPTQSEASMKELENHFVTFDDQFEYGSQLPGIFVRDWTNSKRWLLSLFKKITPTIMLKDKSEDQTLFQSLVGDIEGPWGPQFGLLSLWASLANAIPITFWTLGFLLEHPESLRNVKNEITTVLGMYNGENVHIDEDTLKQIPLVKRCVLEAIRLRSPGAIARKVVKPLTIKGYIIPEDDLLLLSPYWAHRNASLFPEPEKFNPSRWEKAELEKGLFLDGFIAFGGGRYQCPGRWFALMEIHLYVTLMIHMFDLELLGCIPTNSPLHLVGSQQPVGPCPVHYQSTACL